jgi:Uncharacterized protein conserved in bacteria
MVFIWIMSVCRM